ncbi:MAG: creatininase family protein [Gemmatimonadales bacterium]
MSNATPWLLAHSVWPTVREQRYEVAVLPWGATEAHNTHLPYATDTIQSEAVAARAAELAWGAGARVVVLPAIPFGVNTGQRDIPFCINLNPSTQAAILADIIETVARHGARKFVVLNGHGGNDFRQMLRELQPRTSMLLCQAHWYNVVNPAPYFAEPGDHAGELETAVMMHLAESLVRPLSSAGTGAARRFAVRGLRVGWAWTQREWSRVTDDTGVGNPAAATAEKGARYFTDVTERLGEFLAELAKIEPEALYE